MKIQCNVCEMAEASVLCCADEAALCWKCDQVVHAANKLASKHQRVPLSTSISQMPKCDICQETLGYFFCLEDRALLCRKCDVAIHSVNSLVSAHQRFLLTGVKVGLEPVEPGPPSSTGKTQSMGRISEPEPPPVPNQTPISFAQQIKNRGTQSGLGPEFSTSKFSFTGGSATGNAAHWQVEEFPGLGDFSQNHDSSKADSGKLGDSDCSSILRSADGILGGDECLDPVVDTFWAVPQIPSPPTASGLYWPKNCQNSFDYGISVPEMGSSNVNHRVDGSKRRRYS